MKRYNVRYDRATGAWEEIRDLKGAYCKWSDVAMLLHALKHVRSIIKEVLPRLLHEIDSVCSDE